MLPSEAVNRPVFSGHSDAPSLVGTLARNAVISGFKAAMAHFVANRCQTPCLPVGVGFEVGRTEEGLALFRLTVRNVGVPGRFTLVDGEFRPAE
jgi:hypothetical protein